MQRSQTPVRVIDKPKCVYIFGALQTARIADSYFDVLGSYAGSLGVDATPLLDPDVCVDSRAMRGTRCLDVSRTCYMESLRHGVACYGCVALCLACVNCNEICNSECDLVYVPPASSQVTRALSLELTG